MHKDFDINSLKRICIVGAGLLGGSIGLALRAAGFVGTRVGLGRRAISLEKALACEAVDEVTLEPAEGVRGADLVVLCTPIGHFEGLLDAMRAHLEPGALVTDIASTKVQVVRLCERKLPRTVQFVGSHPMAGSEKTGVEFARADLFELALCIVTPTPRTAESAVVRVRRFWETLGAYTMTLSPGKHDRLLARVSHLPHALATALVTMSLTEDAIDLAGPGFADVTRLASGDPAMWVDILRTNRRGVLSAIDRLTAELQRLRRRLERDDAAGLHKWLAGAKAARDAWISSRYRKRILPS